MTAAGSIVVGGVSEGSSEAKGSGGATADCTGGGRTTGAKTCSAIAGVDMVSGSTRGRMKDSTGGRTTGSPAAGGGGGGDSSSTGASTCGDGVDGGGAATTGMVRGGVFGGASGSRVGGRE